MDLGEALVEAIEAPIAPTGLHAEILFVSRWSGGQGATATGVRPSQWNAWLSHARGAGGTRPSAASRAKIRAAVRRTITGWWQRLTPPPSRATITAHIVWGGYTNPVPHRTTTLNMLSLDSVFSTYSVDPSVVADAFNAATTARYGTNIEFTDITELKI